MKKKCFRNSSQIGKKSKVREIAASILSSKYKGGPHRFHDKKYEKFKLNSKRKYCILFTK